MASVGHIAVGMAAARLVSADRRARWPLIASMAVWSLLSSLPDADVVGFRFGVTYSDPWGHRGATHSFVFALVVAAISGALLAAFRARSLYLAVVVFAVVASHPVLDSMTDGGHGCALYWPFDNTRHFAPWRPIPVSPIGWSFFTTHGMSVALREVFLFAPLFAYALWPRREARHGASA